MNLIFYFLFFIIKHSYTVHLEGSRLLSESMLAYKMADKVGELFPAHHLASIFGRSQVPPTLSEAVSPSIHTTRVGPEGEFISLSKDVAMMAAFLTGQRTSITHRKYTMDGVTKKAPWHQLGGWVGGWWGLPRMLAPFKSNELGGVAAVSSHDPIAGRWNPSKVMI